MILIIPAMDRLELTQRAVESLASTATGTLDFIVVIDNGSDKPIQRGDFPAAVPFSIVVERSEPENLGFYRPLEYVHRRWQNEILILMHNDLVLYEKGWDAKLQACFEYDDRLGLVGLCGSNELDPSGGRGGGTMCYFRGAAGYQSQAAGQRIHDLRPVVILDSLFMAFRKGTVEALEEDWPKVPLAHFYDKIWPLRLIRRGWRVGVLGSECDHMGGGTIWGNIKYLHMVRKWAEPLGLKPPKEEPGNWDLAQYLEAQRRLFTEFGNGIHCYPMTIDRAWNVTGGTS